MVSDDDRDDSDQEDGDQQLPDVRFSDSLVRDSLIAFDKEDKSQSLIKNDKSNLFDINRSSMDRTTQSYRGTNGFKSSLILTAEESNQLNKSKDKSFTDIKVVSSVSKASLAGITAVKEEKNEYSPSNSP